MPTTVRLARCAAKAGHSHWEPTSSTARPKWVVVGLTRLRAEPENMDAGHTVCQRGSRQQIFGDQDAVGGALFSTLRNRPSSRAGAHTAAVMVGYAIEFR
jgi:hypothetical protein